LSEEVPATQLTVMARIEMDERVREIMRLAGTRSLPIAEASRTDLDRMTDHAVHQGVALTIPPYEYADPDELLQIASDAFEPPLLVALDGITDPRNLGRSEEHTSELQSRFDLVCRLLLEKKKNEAQNNRQHGEECKAETVSSIIH